MCTRCLDVLFVATESSEVHVRMIRLHFQPIEVWLLALFFLLRGRRAADQQLLRAEKLQLDKEAEMGYVFA